MKRVVGLAAFQVVVLLGWAAQNEYVRATAPTFRIPLQPRDPYDVLRGRYFVLNPRDSSIRTGQQGVVLTVDEVQRFLGSDTLMSLGNFADGMGDIAESINNVSSSINRGGGIVRRSKLRLSRLGRQRCGLARRATRTPVWRKKA